MSIFTGRIAFAVVNISVLSLTVAGVSAFPTLHDNVKESAPGPVSLPVSSALDRSRALMIADVDPAAEALSTRPKSDSTSGGADSQPVKANIVTAEDSKSAPIETPPAKPVITGSVVASDLEQEYAKKHHKTFVGKMVKGVSQELGSSLEYMAKDSAFVFSAQDYDANRSSAPKNRPYEDYHIRWADGTRSNIIRYPNGEQVIATGHRAGTVITPIDKMKSDILYSDGQHGTLIKSDEGGFSIVRNHKVTMQLSPKIGGGYYISNGDGEMGTIEPSVVDTHYGYYSMRDNMGDF